jgi:hypothetical protein
MIKMKAQDYFGEHKRLVGTLFSAAEALKTKSRKDDAKAKMSLIKEEQG